MSELFLLSKLLPVVPFLKTFSLYTQFTDFCIKLRYWSYIPWTLRPPKKPDLNDLYCIAIRMGT